jgi:signal peptidase I
VGKVRLVARASGTLLLALLAALSICTATGWLHVTPILSGSMRGAFNPGDALLTQRVPATSLQVGQVVDVKVPLRESNGAGHRAHRIVSLRKAGSTVVIRTKGDANTAVDPDSITLHGEQYVMRARLPYVGWIVDFKAAHGYVLLLGLVALLGLLSVGQFLWLRRPSRRRLVPQGRQSPAPCVGIAS